MLNPDYLGATFSSMKAVFELITRKVSERTKKLVLIIDKLPYWAEKTKHC
ncbi:hypothetical protein [[Clostridium] aminophilum]|nr:hypothetical protein [[Clostridium] aminophilum]